MTFRNYFKVISAKELLIFFVIFISGAAFVAFIWNETTKQENDKVIQVAKSVEASLPLEGLKALAAKPEDLTNPSYRQLKNALQNVIRVNKNAKFAYLYFQRDGKLFFIVDSEPETSADYSPPGQEFTEADQTDKKPFENGKALVTKPVTDRWGTWISAEVPVIDAGTGQVIAVLGMDYNARSWKTRIFFEVFESALLVIIILFLAIASRRSIRKNKLLQTEISQREKVEKELKENELTLSNLISNLPGMVYRCALDENYTMEFMSEACFRITGYLPDDFIATKTISFNDLILNEYRQPIWAKWQKTLAEKSVFEEEYPIQTASGEIKWVWERGGCIFDKNDKVQYLEGYIEDITEWKLAEYELGKLSQAIEQNPVSVFITNSNGIIEYVNPQFTVMTGYKASEVIGQNSNILRSGKLQNEFYDNLWETITSGKIWNGEVLNQTKSGELYWASKSVSPIIDAKGRITNFVSICEDITEKKKNETELIKAKEKAEESDRLKSAFLANLSHEIRTPMNGILGFAELLKEPDLSAENQHEFIEVIEKSGQRMLNIINDLINISKIEAGETTLIMQGTSINKMLQELHLFFMPEINKKDLDVDYHCDLPDEKCMIETDSTKLNQILANLIKNAIKFTEKGAITFGYRIKNSKIEFYCADTGPGIPPELKEVIFERFRQGTLGINRKHEGAGLGLAISKAYVELLGGSMWVESEFGNGSTFFFELPYPSHDILLS